MVLGLCQGALGCAEQPADTGSVSEDSTSPADSYAVAFGINSDYFEDFVKAVPGAVGYRAYARQPDANYPDGYVPTQWEAKPGLTTIFSLYLKHDALLAGKFDQQLLDFFKTAPENSYVSLWQEVGAMDWSRFGIDPSNIASMNDYMQKLINAHRGGGPGKNQADHIKFGPIVIGVSYINKEGEGEFTKLKDLMKGGPYDFYGLDVYDGDGNPLRNSNGFIVQKTVNEKMDFFRIIARQLSARESPEIVITEVNSPKHNNRAGLFSYLGEWMNGHGGKVMLTHYDATGSASGPWLPCDKDHPNGCATIKALDYLQEHFGAIAPCGGQTSADAQLPCVATTATAASVN